MSETSYDVPPEYKQRAYVKEPDYHAMCERSIADPAASWASEATRIHWFKAPSKIKNLNYGPGNASIKWFEDGITNVAHICIDRHLGKRADACCRCSRMAHAK